MVDDLYGELDRVHKSVPTLGATYLAACRRRSELVRALRAAGESLGKIGKRLELSDSRVEQITKGKKSKEAE
jgi:hypothetical protein